MKMLNRSEFCIINKITEEKNKGYTELELWTKLPSQLAQESPCDLLFKSRREKINMSLLDSNKWSITRYIASIY